MPRKDKRSKGSRARSWPPPPVALWPEGVPLAPGIDWEKIAMKFALTGGYIKNAIVSALLLAISRDLSFNFGFVRRGVTKIRDPNIDSQIVGSPYNKDPQVV